MNYQIIVRPEAESDLNKAFQWYEVQSPGLGLEFLRCVDDSFDVIQQNPLLYQKIYKDNKKISNSPFPLRNFLHYR